MGMSLAISPVAGAVLRGLTEAAGDRRHEVLLSEFRSTDWQSLTFIGEKHDLTLIYPSDKIGDLEALIERENIEIPDHILADIAIAKREPAKDGFERVSIEALTVQA